MLLLQDKFAGVLPDFHDIAAGLTTLLTPSYS